MSIRMIARFLVPVLAALATGCGDSAASRSKGVEELDAIKARWDDAVEVAGATPRIALSGPVTNLQQIRRDLDAAALSECLGDARKALAGSMDVTIPATLAFMADNDAGKALFAAAEALDDLNMKRYAEARELCLLGERDAQALVARREAERKAAEEQRAREEAKAKAKREAELAAARAKRDAEMAARLAKCPRSATPRQAGARFRDPLGAGAEGPEMVVVPAGDFDMGPIDGDSDEQPLHPVAVCAFALGRTEVTFADYDRFAKATRRALPDDRGWGRGDRPVIDVSWEDASAYAGWLAQQTGRKYRLPTEAEWEYAARAGTTTAYPWGDSASHDHANYGKDQCCGGFSEGRDQWINTAPVGSFEANAFGLHDMHGNVWEWVQDCYADSYEGAPADGSAREQCENTDRRVLRGGSWYGLPAWLRSADRIGWDASFRDDGGGFRLAQDLE